MQQAAHETISRAIQGDSDALSTLLETTGRQVRHHLSRQMPHRWQSILTLDDVMQVTYLEAFLRISQFRGNGQCSFEGWLKRIAENNLRDAIRALERGKRPPPQVQDQALHPEGSCAALLERLSDSTISPSRCAGRAEVCELVKTAVARLPDDYRRAVQMFDLEGCDSTAVAAALGRSEGAVYMLRARAHDRLRELLGAETNFFSDSA